MVVVVKMPRTALIATLLLWLQLSHVGASLRHHGRHRREPGPRADANPQSQFLAPREHLLKEEQKQNIFKPKFERCKEYQPEVEEEESRGKRFIQVHAVDEDGDGPNGRVTYSIVSKHNKFKIDPQTGWLSTSAVFNRDEPDREKVVYVTVKATDDGRPKLEDICTLAVKIKDKNDNAPVFDRSSYDVKIAQDMEVGELIMRISATDVDEGINQRISYNLSAVRYPSDIEYFKWHYQTGEVTLNKKIDKPINYLFQLKATAIDGGVPPKSSTIHVTLEVNESFNKSPSFETGPGPAIDISEGFNDFSKPIATYTARSNIPDDPTVFFQLVRGRTEQTNKDDTFRAVQSAERPNEVNIYLAKTLQYEKVSKYTLTLQVRNSPNLAAEALLTIAVTDENNQAPVFTNVESGNVLEHEPEGAIVMQVSAVDNDGSYPNNKVTYRISSRNSPKVRSKFSINANTGVVTTNEEFDREEQAVYALIIEAVDGAPSALLKNGDPNVTPQNFRIEIADKNDNPPYFRQQRYPAEVPEDQDVGSKVIEVRAEDKDEEASITTYQIMSGNQGNAFRIEEQTGIIRVAKPLDYEMIKEYSLLVGAWDGQFGNQTTVEITVINVNDMKPKFLKDKYVAQLVEESVPSYPILSVSAIDPDIGDETVDQNITYYLDQSSDKAKNFWIDPKTGSVKVVKKLDRDAPNGFPKWSLYIFAKDENGGPTGIENYVELEINLEDINDNAPFLDMGDGLVWDENQPPGDVGVLQADDYDTPEENGPPFSYSMQEGSPMKEWFDVSQSPNGSYVLRALVTFDREMKKQYDIPIKICDNKNVCAVDLLKLTIGDKNDNPMEAGSSEIFVYNYEGKAPDTQIGRVYVKDPDDWDLPDKTFLFKDKNRWTNSFALDRNTGMITMKRGISLPDEFNNFIVDFVVEDPVHGQTGASAVAATVNITIQKIPEEAVVKSGSMRIRGDPEDFIAPDFNGISKKDRFKTLMSDFLNATYVDIFTVLPVEKKQKEHMIDIRFSAHGSPYLEAEKLDGTLIKQKEYIVSTLGIDIEMIQVDDCIYESTCPGSCVSYLKIDDQPFGVFTNTSSFVGVNARMVPHCGCDPPIRKPQSCFPNPCLNGGTCEDVLGGYRCTCPADNPEFFGPNCERLTASFNGQGWSWHPGLSACGNSHISMVFNTQNSEGTLFYAGPSPLNVIDQVTDYMSLEINKGRLKAYVNFGDGTKVLDLDERVDNGVDHTVVLRWTNDTVQIELDDKTCSNTVSPSKNQCFLQITTQEMKQRYLNTLGPLQVGGVSFGSDSFDDLASLLRLQRSDMPVGSGFAGCIRNMSFTAGSNTRLYDLGSPADGENYKAGCSDEFVQASTALGINTNFLIAILVCLLIVMIGVIFLAVYRRRRTVFRDKDIDCDIRENIINYEDEGGGEGDQTGYDLSVLRMMSDGTPALHAGDPKKMHHLHDPPDIKTFLQTNKDRADGDPDSTPYDDLRHYAYEGDGNSNATLSSLNSGTSDGDLEFDYLHNFGPRFKKLADMYGEEPDSEDEQQPHHQQPHHPHSHHMGGVGALPSESWC